MAARLSCTASKQGQPGQRTRSTNGGHARFPRQIAVCVSTHPLFATMEATPLTTCPGVSFSGRALPAPSAAHARFSASQTVQIPSMTALAFHSLSSSRPFTLEEETVAAAFWSNMEKSTTQVVSCAEISMSQRLQIRCSVV